MDPISLTRSLLRFETVNPPGREADCARHAGRLLEEWGYRVVPVRPGISRVLGEKAYARLAQLPEKPDLVNVFRSSDQVARVVDECIALGLPAIWIQQGIVNEPAAARARIARRHGRRARARCRARLQEPEAAALHTALNALARQRGAAA